MPTTTDIRRYLNVAYGDEELTILCFDRFRAVHDGFAAGMSMGQKIQRLLEYCERHDAISELLTALERDRPKQFEATFGPLTAASAPAHRTPRAATVQEDARELESQRRQLAEMLESLRLIEERKAEYVLGVEVPLQLVKEERKLRERIAGLEERIRRLEEAVRKTGNTPPQVGGGGGESLPSAVEAGDRYYSCFISYSSKDEAFAERLHGDLEARGVECWFAPEDMRIGDKIRQRIDDEILQHAKLLLILSANSVASDWVESEVEAAFDKERSTKTTVLFPIRLDDAVMTTQAAWAAEIRRTRHIGDFSKWQDAGAYARGLARLLRDLEK